MVARPIAMITGASSGIGEAFASLLAADGHDLVLVARDNVRLEHIAACLGDRYHVKVDIIPADLTIEDRVKVVEDRLSGEDSPVDVLINCAGSGRIGDFREMPLEELMQVIDLHIVALTRLTYGALAMMGKRGSGSILNVSSQSAFQAVPGNAMYTASKAYITILTESIHEEAKGSGVRVTCLCPGFTRTSFHEHAGMNVERVPAAAWMSPNSVARAGLRAMSQNRALCVPGNINKLGVFLTRIMPRSALRRGSGMITRRL